MSDLLTIGASGVRAYQTALATVGENIANADVAGYSRRTVSMKELAGSQGTTAARADAGGGVMIGAITRSGDAYASAAVRAAGSDLSRTTATSTWLTRIQSALTDNGLNTRVTSFFSAANSLSAEPTSTALRAGILGAATSAAAAFTATGASFDRIDADYDSAATDATQTLSSLAVSLSRVNDGLGRTQQGTSAAAQLADQRDQILDQMSSLTTISSTTDSIGRATVKIGGTAGQTFVSLTQTGSASYQRNTDGTVAFTVNVDGHSSALAPDGGTIAGLIDGAQKIAAARTQVQTVATGFTTSVNAVQAQGDDLDGNPGAALFATGSRPTDVSVAMTDGTQIAAARRGGGVRDASNLDALQSMRTAQGFEASLTDEVTGTATSISQKQTIIDAQTAIHDGAVATLSNASGVSLDAEAVDLMRFQQAYSASSRVIQVARETFQSILDIR